MSERQSTLELFATCSGEMKSTVPITVFWSKRVVSPSFFAMLREKRASPRSRTLTVPRDRAGHCSA